jgi:multiple sugar transport system substrate-binding protein
MTVRLCGITWNHSRGYLPMVATAQRFSEITRAVDIIWEKRGLASFRNDPVGPLAKVFDLIVLNPASIGEAVRAEALIALDEYLPKEFLEDQALHSVGRSYESYQFEGRQWALAIDAAAQVSACRPILLEQSGLRAPGTWRELVTLARRGWLSLDRHSTAL